MGEKQRWTIRWPAAVSRSRGHRPACRV